MLEIDLNKPDARPAPKPFWSFHEKATYGKANQSTASDEQVIDEFDALLSDAVTRRMIADVPLGVFLSGGVDSSTVVALMQEASSKPIKTFSIGFEESKYNEAEYAAEIAKHLGTDHTELYVSPQQALDVIPKLTEMYDEPYADSSQIPTFLVSELTRKHVTVALSGDGGDELFAGYTRYQTAEQIAGRIGKIPMPVRKALSSIWQTVPRGTWDSLFKVVPKKRRPMYAGDKVHKFAEAFTYDEDDFYKRLISIWNHPEEIAAHGKEADTLLTNSTLSSELPNLLDRMQYWDTMMYMPDDILTIVNPVPVERIWAEHLSGNRNWAALLWNVIMLQSWCQKNM